jgi:hypothetical protein
MLLCHTRQGNMSCARPHLPQAEQAAAPLDHVGVGRVLELQVERIAQRPARALRAKGVAVHDGIARLLPRKLPAWEGRGKAQNPLRATPQCMPPRAQTPCGGRRRRTSQTPQGHPLVHASHFPSYKNTWTPNVERTLT